MDVARFFLARGPDPLTAYLELECALMRQYVKVGGTPEEFVRRFGPAFRRAFGWMCEQQ